MICCVKFGEVKLNKVCQAGPGQVLHSEDYRDSYVSANCIIVSCRSFRVLWKALLSSGETSITLTTDGCVSVWS